jgi:hypothetical protein
MAQSNPSFVTLVGQVSEGNVTLQFDAYTISLLEKILVCLTDIRNNAIETDPRLYVQTQLDF